MYLDFFFFEDISDIWSSLNTKGLVVYYLWGWADHFAGGFIFKIVIVFGGSLSEKEAFPRGSFNNSYERGKKKY